MLQRLKTKAIMTVTLALLVASVATAKSPSPSPTAAATPAAIPAGSFVSTDKKDSPFHKSTCSSAKQIKKPVIYATKDEAVKAGHKPCKNCKPDK